MAMVCARAILLSIHDWKTLCTWLVQGGTGEWPILVVQAVGRINSSVSKNDIKRHEA